MIRRGLNDNDKTRKLIDELGLSFVTNRKCKRIFIKVSDTDFATIKKTLEQS